MHLFRPIFSLLLVILFFQSARPQPSQVSQPDNQIFTAKLQALIAAAGNNPRLKAADAKVQASFSSVNIRKSLDPPQVAVEFYQAPVASFPNPFKDQMEYDYSIQQMIPFPGKLGAMAGAEQKRTDMLKADRRTLEQDIVRNVKSTYYELYLIYRRLETNHETRELVRSFVAVARKQYETGMGKQSDVLRAQTELSVLVNDSLVLSQQRKSMEGMLNALCNRPITTEIGFIPEIEPVINDYNPDSLMQVAKKNRPELKSMQAGIRMQQAERCAAGKDFLPDFMLRGTYKQMARTTDDWALMIGATVPIAPWSFGKYSSGTTQAEAKTAEAQAELDNMKNMIVSEVNDALLKVESGNERLKLSKETSIPQAQQALESAMAAYKTGKQDFLMLIDIQRMLVMAKLDYHMAVMNLLDSQSRLERAVGISLDEIDKVSERGNR
ncbi:MAG: TolC family protein [Chitinivibrionales bacterium]|nr:TolC family protein [Chitinivibrionales bacterium]